MQTPPSANQPSSEHERSDAASKPLVVIEPPRGWVPFGLAELWRYRELLYFFVWRDIKVRYKQTFFGVAWAILQPVFMMVVFTIFFGKLARLPSEGVPYPIFAYCALLPWQLFANAIGGASNSLVANQAMVKKVYFPRLLLPLSAVLDGLVDFLIAFVLLLGMMAYYGIAPTVNVLYLPLMVLLVLLTAFAVGLWLSAFNVRYRDVRYTIPFLTQLWLFASPVAYSSTLVPEEWRSLYGLNPMAGVVDGFRWALLGRETAPSPIVAVSCLVVIVALFGGLAYFRRMEKTFADVI